MGTGLIEKFTFLIAPLADLLHLPSSAIGPVTVYIFSPRLGIIAVANLMEAGSV